MTFLTSIKQRKDRDAPKVKHKINTDDSPPIKQRPYRISPAEMRVIEDEVHKMFKADVIQQSESPWPSLSCL
ncbi:hypothetical protein JTE90_008228 [Oedothorax gibbosus]|uniref:Uncharacterized protein n=1 Tax=Oedothorax gibbosus TaxID=931172 RepID=A0AAV6TQ81_9ARAC|nr:hypothetical protein JTE90_008228 [Oedothorax gibbosus]